VVDIQARIEASRGVNSQSIGISREDLARAQARVAFERDALSQSITRIEAARAAANERRATAARASAERNAAQAEALGKAVTADDFVFGWQVSSDASLEIVDRASALRVQSMTAPDARTLIVTWKEPYAYYAYFRNHEPLPRHVIGEAYQKNKATLKQSPYGTRPLLGGSFTVSEWVSQSHVTLVRNKAAKLWAPQLDEITWKIIPQTQTI